MNAEAVNARRGAADWLVLVGRFAALVYVNVLVWLSLWVLVPTLFMGWKPMAIDSGSMGPSIHTGDVVLVSPFTGEPLQPGRVVTFADPAEPDRLVTHRVAAVNDDGTYRTKGDANTDADSTPLMPEQIHGVGRLVVPRVGVPVVWLAQGSYAALAAWAVSVALALILLAPSTPVDRTPAGEKPRVRRGLFRRADTAASGGGPVGSRRANSAPASFADRPVPQSAARPAVLDVGSTAFSPSLPVPPGVAAPAGSAFALAMPAPPARAAYALVPAVRYRLRLPEPPAPLELPAPPRWTVSLVPPPPGTRPVGPIPPPPRPAAVRRGTALTTRDVPGWTGRLHAMVLVLALTSGLLLFGTASAPPASAAFSSTHHRIVNNTGNSFTADQLAPPYNPAINAPLAACKLQVSWSSSPSSWETGYRIYRSVDGAAYTLIGTMPDTAVIYSDNTATNPARVYAYKMVAYRAVNWESSATAPVSASPSLAACST